MKREPSFVVVKDLKIKDLIQKTFIEIIFNYTVLTAV